LGQAEIKNHWLSLKKWKIQTPSARRWPSFRTLKEHTKCVSKPCVFFLINKSSKVRERTALMWPAPWAKLQNH
jgi:hypothetical protein